jgi:hypothetical protein
MMNKKVQITIVLLGVFAIVSAIFGSGIATGFKYASVAKPLNTIVSEASKSLTVPDNCITLYNVLECRDSLTRSYTISTINESDT